MTAVTFRMYPDQPGDRFTASAAEKLVGQRPTIQGQPATVTAATFDDRDGSIVVTVESDHGLLKDLHRQVTHYVAGEPGDWSIGEKR